MYPESSLGMVFGTLALLAGLIVLALPVTVIVAKFSDEYEKSKMEKAQKGDAYR